MRNDSSSYPAFGRTLLSALAAAVVLVICSAVAYAQCLGGDDPGSLSCQIQQQPQADSPDSSALAGESPSVSNFSQSEQERPRDGGANEALTKDSLSGGAIYTESAPLGHNAARPARAATPLRPEPPTEFQRFVAATTGEILPVFGADLFTGRQASFGPISHAPAPASLIVGADDELRIRIWGQINFSANLRVSREGEIYLPKVGAVHVAGMPVAAVRDHLREALDRVYRNFEISVDLGEIHSIQVYVAGHARRPGEYTVSALGTLVDAVFASGGPSASGSMRHIELKRDGKVVTDFDLYALLVKGDKTGDAQLQPGDVIFIPAAGPQVALLGSVRQPGIYELRGNETLAYALDAAGGRTAMALGARIAVERIDTHGQRRAFDASAGNLDVTLADGDIVRVDSIASHYRDTVTLRGSVANPGRFRWHPGMRLSELMPDRDSLVSRGYWWRRTQLGLPAPEFTAAPEQSAESSQSENRAAGGGFTHGENDEQDGKAGGTDKAAALLSPGAQTNWDYAVIERLDPATMKTSLISFDPGKLVLDHDRSEDRELKAGDVVTIFSQDDVHPPVDRRTKYIELEGEIVKAGVYSVAPGETLRSVVMRAGGLTPKAYLYGAEFTRKSTQALEQQRLNDYADRLEQQMERNSVALASMDDADSAPAASQGAAASINRDLVARLRQLHATGRIVLNVSPASDSAADLPDIPLEDGDKLVVPSTPSTIQVIGAVFNQNAFLYHPGAKAGDYLRYAGGPTREADRRQVFVLRADGSVFSRAGKQSLFAAAAFDDVRLYPGDTIVVPEKMARPSASRQLAAWTQVMSQISLSAAAVDVIK